MNLLVVLPIVAVLVLLRFLKAGLLTWVAAWWVALFAYGEGWHNNHHAHPRLARAGHRWWEIDMTFWAIRALQAVGLAYEVDDRIPVGRTAEE